MAERHGWGGRSEPSYWARLRTKTDGRDSLQGAGHEGSGSQLSQSLGVEPSVTMNTDGQTKGDRETA